MAAPLPPAAPWLAVETFLGTGSLRIDFTGLSGEIWRLPSCSVTENNFQH